MTSLVIRHQTLAALAHDAILFLRTGHDALDCITDLVVADLGEFATGSQDGSLIQQVGQISTGVAGGPTRHFVQVNVLGQRLAAGVDIEDLETTGVIGPVHGDLSIETTGAHQRSIQDVRTVGRRDDDDAGVALETIHLRQELVEGLFPFIVTATEASATLTADSIDLVNEDDAGSVFLGLFEQVTNTTGTDAHEHLDELRAGDREEGDTRLTCNGLGEQGLTGAWRAHQQHTLGDLGSNGREAIRILEEVDDLGEFELGAFNAGNIAEGDLGGRLHLHPGLALAELHGGVTTAAALGTAEEEEQPTQQQQREDQASSGLLPGRSLTGGLHGDINIVLRQQTQQLLVGSQVHLGAAAVVFHHLSGAPIRGDQHATDLVVLNRFNEIAVAHGPRFLLGVATAQEGRGDHHDRQD